MMKVKVRLVLVLAVLTAVFSLIGIVRAATADPGSEENPLVSQDYVDKKISDSAKQATDSINTLNASVASLSKTVNDLTNQVSELKKTNDTLKQQLDGQMKETQFQVVELKQGQQLLAGASTEFIIRSGKASAVSGKLGGLSDITAGTGKDLVTGQDIPLNHLLLVSRDDGRGIKAVDKTVYLIFKGKYTVK